MILTGVDSHDDAEGPGQNNMTPSIVGDRLLLALTRGYNTGEL